MAAIFTTYPETIDKILQKVGNIDEHVSNNNFNDLQDILDIKGSNADRRENDPPSKLDVLTS